MENEVLKNIKERRSIKAYSEKQITDEELKTVLEAGTFAPTGMNRQSPVIVAVQNKDDIETLRKMNAKILGSENSDPFYGAPTVIVVLADKSASTHVEDGSLVMQNLMLAAHSLGLGSCWVHRAKEEFESPEGKALLKKWGLSENLRGIGHCLLGHQKGDTPPLRPRKDGYYKIIK